MLRLTASLSVADKIHTLYTHSRWESDLGGMGHQLRSLSSKNFSSDHFQLLHSLRLRYIFFALSFVSWRVRRVEKRQPEGEPEAANFSSFFFVKSILIDLWLRVFFSTWVRVKCLAPKRGLQLWFLDWQASRWGLAVTCPTHALPNENRQKPLFLRTPFSYTPDSWLLPEISDA